MCLNIRVHLNWIKFYHSVKSSWHNFWSLDWRLYKKNYSELDWLYIIIHKKLLKNMQKSRCEIIVYQTKYNYNIPRPCIYAKWVKINASGKIQHRNYFKEVEWKWYTWISILSKWPLLIIWDDSFIDALGQFSNIVFMYTLELIVQDASLFRHPY